MPAQKKNCFLQSLHFRSFAAPFVTDHWSLFRCTAIQAHIARQQRRQFRLHYVRGEDLLHIGDSRPMYIWQRSGARHEFEDSCSPPRHSLVVEVRLCLLACITQQLWHHLTDFHVVSSRCLCLLGTLVCLYVLYQ